MLSTKLVVVDGLWNHWLDGAMQCDSDQTEWVILPLGVDCDQYQQENNLSLQKLIHWRFVNYPELADTAQEVIRASLPRLIHDLAKQEIKPGMTLQNLFETPKANLWWFLELTEKSPMRGPFVNRLYFLALILTAVRTSQHPYEDVWLAVSDDLLAEKVSKGIFANCRRMRPPLRSNIRSLSLRSWTKQNWVVQYFTNVVRITASHFLRWWFFSSMRNRLQTWINPRSTVIFSFYPVWWLKAYEMDAEERFFTALPLELQKKGHLYHAVWVTAGPFQLWKRRKQIQALFRKKGIIPLNLLAGLKSLGAVLDPRHLKRALNLIGLAKQIRCSFQGLDISDWVKREILLSMTSSEFFLDIMLMVAFRSLTENASISTVLYRLEFQPFEKALLYGIRNRSRGIAFQHSTFGRNYLPYFFLPGELNNSMPLPDRILTAGPYGKRVIEKGGYKTENLEISGPLRYSELFRIHSSQNKIQLRKNFGIAPHEKVILVTTSVVRQTSLGLIASFSKIIDHWDKYPYILFRDHPAAPVKEAFLRLVARKIGRDRYKILSSLDSIYDFMSLADAVISTGSTLCVESIMLGVTSIVYESNAVFDAKSMGEFRDAFLVVRNRSELEKAIQTVFNNDSSLQLIKNRWPKTINELFYKTEQDPNKRFLELLEKNEVLTT